MLTFMPTLALETNILGSIHDRIKDLLRLTSISTSCLRENRFFSSLSTFFIYSLFPTYKTLVRNLNRNINKICQKYHF